MIYRNFALAAALVLGAVVPAAAKDNRIGATLIFYKGAHYFMPEVEKVREAYNAWIKIKGGFDSVADLATAVADEYDPTSFDAGFNLNDRLNPNDAGYLAMAVAIKLNVIRENRT